MARTSKVKKVEENIETKIEEKTETKIEEIKAPRRMSRKAKSEIICNLDKARRVPVVSVCGFPIGYQCKKEHLFLKWADNGDEHMMTIEEVLIMNSENKKFLQEPWLIVDDEEFVEYMGWKNTYELIFEIEDLNEFYNQHAITIEKKLDKLPNGARRDVINRTIKMISDGELSNFAVVRLLKSKYNVDIEI